MRLIENLDYLYLERLVSLIYQAIHSAEQPVVPFGDPSDILHRLGEFFKLFLSDGLNSEFAYQFGLKDA